MINSRSFTLLALASDDPVIASDIAPVREVIRCGGNGWRVDFFNAGALDDHIFQALAHPPSKAPRLTGCQGNRGICGMYRAVVRRVRVKLRRAT